MNITKSLLKLDLFKIISKHNVICVIIIAGLFTIDRFFKNKIINNQLNTNSIFINDYLNFDLVWNRGIGFGIFALEANIYYHLISLLILFVLFFLIYLIIKSNLIDKILFSAIFGGAIGNFYDRITYYAVPDFIDLHYNEYHWFTFNIADIFITLGIILIIIKDLIFKQNAKN